LNPLSLDLRMGSSLLVACRCRQMRGDGNQPVAGQRVIRAFSGRFLVASVSAGADGAGKPGQCGSRSTEKSRGGRESGGTTR
jgi:hypothetical protein